MSMTLEALAELPVNAPTLIWHRAPDGSLSEVLVRVQGVYASRQLLILTRIVETSATLEIEHPYYTAWMNNEDIFITTRNGNAARVYQDGPLIKADDGGGRLITLIEGGTGVIRPSLEHIERVARTLYAEVSGEATCEVCGCTNSWGCDEGCGWAEPGLCTACAEHVQPSNLNCADMRV